MLDFSRLLFFFLMIRRPPGSTLTDPLFPHPALFRCGIKADLWDRRARIGFNVFRYDVSDQQIIAVGGGANIATLLNADKTIGQGFELDAQAYLTDNLLVTQGSSYNDTEIDDPGLDVPGCGAIGRAPVRTPVTKA